MSNYRFFILAVFFIISLGADAYSFEKELSLMEITDFALQHNPATHQAWARVRLAAADLGIAESTYYPQINAGAAVEYSTNIFSNPGGASGSRFASGPNVNFSYLLLDFGQRSNTAKAAKYALVAAELNQNSVIQQVILQVQQAYYQLLGQQELRAAYQKTVSEAQTSLAAAQALRANGLATVGDVYQAEAALAQAQLNWQQSQGNYQIALGQLASSMGLPVNTPLKLAPLSSIGAIESVQQNITHLLQEAKKHRPDLLAAQAQVHEAQSQREANKAAALPKVQLTAMATPEGNSLSVSNAAVSLSVSVPLFTGFAQTHAQRHAAAQVLSAQASRDQLAQQVELQVWQAYFALQTAEQAVSTSEVLLRSSLQASQQAQGQYKAGVGTILAVLSTQSDLANARVQAVQAKLSWYLGLAQLAAAMGSLYGV